MSKPAYPLTIQKHYALPCIAGHLSPKVRLWQEPSPRPPEKRPAVLRLRHPAKPSQEEHEARRIPKRCSMSENFLVSLAATSLMAGPGRNMFGRTIRNGREEERRTKLEKKDMLTVSQAIPERRPAVPRCSERLRLRPLPLLPLTNHLQRYFSFLAWLCIVFLI